MIIKVSVDRFDKVLIEEAPSGYTEAFIITKVNSSAFEYPDYERYHLIDKIRTMVSNSEDGYIYVDYDMVLWMEKEGL